MAIFNQSFTLSAVAASPRVVAPLTGSVTTGTWIVNQHQTLASSPSGIGYMNYNVLLPAQYSSSLLYPVLFVLHPDFAGMSGSGYPADGASFVADGRYISSTQSVNSLYNNVSFRTAFPCIIVAPQCDQTLGDADANGNFGGYNDSQNSGWNERAVNACLTTIIASYSVDPKRRYCIGQSLGGIGVLAYLVDNNSQNGPGSHLWTGGATFSDQLFRTTANNTVFNRMSSVPLFCVSTSVDNDPTSYDEPAWTSYTGNTSYPAMSSYNTSGVSGVRAGTTQFYYINNGSNQPDSCMQLNALGGNGTAFFTWLFSQII